MLISFPSYVNVKSRVAPVWRDKYTVDKGIRPLMP